MTDLHARLLAEIERRETCEHCGHRKVEHFGEWCRAVTGAVTADGGTRICGCEGASHDDPVLAYLAALRGVVELVGTWTHEVVDDCWYTCAAATDERDGGETCSDARRGGACDCGLDTRRSQVLAIVAEALGVTP